VAGPLLFDNVRDATTTTGTGSFALLGTPPNTFRAFGAVLSNLDTCYYSAKSRTGNEWEVGLGTYSSTGPTLARTLVLASSNGGDAVNFSAGTKDVWMDVPATVFAPLLNPDSLAHVTAGYLLAVNDGTLEVALPAALSAVANLTPAADRLAYYTGSSAAALATFTAFARTLMDDADAPTARNTLGVPVHAIQPGGRLTLSSTLSVTLSDQTAVSTLRYLPHAHDRIPLYDGSAWNLRSISGGLSLSLSGLTSSRLYDVFAYDNAGTPTLELTIWTDDTTRATALTTQDGRLVRSGATTRLFLGTIRTTGTTTTEDSNERRFVSNAYNQVARPLLKRDATAHTYSGGSWREWNNASDVHRVRWVAPVDGNKADVFLTMYSDTAAGSNTVMIGGVGIDSANPDSGSAAGTGCGIYALTPFRISGQVQHAGQGYHYGQCWEWSGGGTWSRYELRGTVWG
jgi:hypothetical protein